jgi:uncharacterized protein YkuJ
MQSEVMNKMKHSLTEIHVLNSLGIEAQDEVVKNKFNKFRDSVKRIDNLSEGQTISSISYIDTKDSFDLEIVYKAKSISAKDNNDMYFTATKMNNNCFICSSTFPEDVYK